MRLGITYGASDNFFFSSNTIIGENHPFNVYTKMNDDGWVPAVALPGTNLYNPKYLYEPVEEKIQFQIFTGNINGSTDNYNIHAALYNLQAIIESAKMRQRFPQQKAPFLYYVASGGASHSLSVVTRPEQHYIAQILDGEVIFPKDYIRVVALRKALDVELRVIRHGLWLDASSYNFNTRSGAQKFVMSLTNRTFSFPTSGFYNTEANRFVRVSPFANLHDVAIGPFPSVNNLYYAPKGFILYHNDFSAYANIRPDGVSKTGTFHPSISWLTDNNSIIARHNPAVSGWVTYQQDGTTDSAMSLVQFWGTPTQYKSSQFQFFGAVRASGNVTFAIQPIIDYGSSANAFYGQQTLISVSGMGEPDYYYFGSVNVPIDNTFIRANYRVNMVSGSGILDVSNFFVLANDKVYATKLLANPTYSGIVPITTSTTGKPNAFLALNHNYYESYGNNPSSSQKRTLFAESGPNVRLIAETSVTISGNAQDQFFSENYAYNINYLGNLGEPVLFKGKFGDVSQIPAAYTDAFGGPQIYVTCLWTGGSNPQSWVFTYPSGFFTAQAVLYNTPAFPIVPRL